MNQKLVAFEYYEKIANENCAAAAYQIGYFYDNGIEIEKDLKMAFYWFQEAAKNGNKIAQYNLGICYTNGIGVEKD